MSVKVFKEFLRELKGQGIKVEALTLLEVKESINLYKILHK